jgi:hypothetical protein
VTTRLHKKQFELQTPLHAWDIDDVLSDFKRGVEVKYSDLKRLQEWYEHYYFTKVPTADVISDLACKLELTLCPGSESYSVNKKRYSWNEWPIKQRYVWLNTNITIKHVEDDIYDFVIASLALEDPDDIDTWHKNSLREDLFHGDLPHSWELAYRREPKRQKGKSQVTPKTRYEVLVRDDHTCQSCGAKAPNTLLQVDHIFPRSLGGSNEMDNLQTLCIVCNIGKGATYKE